MYLIIKQEHKKVQSQLELEEKLKYHKPINYRKVEHMGKSQAQDRLMAKIKELYPDAFVNDEVYIGDLIEECQYTNKEISEELGHKVHKMFVDIVMHDCDRTVAFEYHGEQHYSLVGNMTKTSADLILNQQLDREKSWILNRIGIPLVAVPFDMYIDDSVMEDLIEKAYEEVDDLRQELIECPHCERFFPQSQMPNGICKSCYQTELEEQEYERQAAEQDYRDEYDNRRRQSRKKNESKEEKMERRAAERAKRKAAYRAYKETPEYKKKKDEARRKRKEYNRQQRERQKQWRQDND